MDSITQKRCSTCRQWQPHSAFWKRKRSKDGLQANCKTCCRATTIAWWGQQDREAYATYHRRWRARNPGRAAVAHRAHYARNREAQIARVVAYRQANHERIKTYERLWRQVNQKNAEYTRRRKARERGALCIPFTREQLLAKFAYWGNRCWVCGGIAQAVDHVKPLAKGGPHCLANLRPICNQDNSTKHDKWPYPPVYERLRARRA